MNITLRPIPRYIDELASHGGLKGVDIANITEVSKATVSRWKAGDIKPQPRSELILSDLHYVVSRLQEFYTPEDTHLALCPASAAGWRAGDRRDP